MSLKGQVGTRSKRPSHHTKCGFILQATGGKEGRAQWWKAPQGSEQLRLCKHNSTAMACGFCKQQHSSASLHSIHTASPAACPRKQTIESVLPNADPFFIHCRGKQPLSVTSILVTKDPTPVLFNHPRIRTPTSWRRSLSLHLPHPLSFPNTRSLPVKGTCSPLPMGHVL